MVCIIEIISIMLYTRLNDVYSMSDGNRATENELMKDGRKISSPSGKIYTLRKYEIIPYINREGIERDFISFKVTDSTKKKIGTVTNYTTEERLHSLIYRFENPEHMEKAEFIARVGETNGFLYIIVPEPVRSWANIYVDDSIDIKLQKKDGLAAEDVLHHISMLKTSYIVNLRRIRRFLSEKDEHGNNLILSTEEFRSGKFRKDLFLKKGDLVKVSLIPKPEYQNFFFADSMKEDVERLKKKEGITE